MWNNGIFDTIKECINDAKQYDNIGGSIFIGECEKVAIGGIYLEDILLSVEEDMDDKVGEASEGWDIYSTTGKYADREPIYDKYNEKLRQLVVDYINEIGEKPSFFNVINIEEVMI